VLRLVTSPTSAADEIFGCSAHQFQLEPRLTREELSAAESSLRAHLPLEYRNFLLEVGSGGAGPEYGLHTLRATSNGWDWDAGPTHRTSTGLISKPFTPHHIGSRPLDPLRLIAPAQYDFEYREDYATAYRNWKDLFWHPDRTSGAVCLCDAGCLRRYWLVISGDERGMIWRDFRVDGVDLAPLFDANGRRVSFATWYLSWMDAVEAALSS
jgi:hypothetical protein